MPAEPLTLLLPLRPLLMDCVLEWWHLCVSGFIQLWRFFAKVILHFILVVYVLVYLSVLNVYHICLC